jgi:thiol-disulfide isomerase/thioredoxin
MLKNVQIFIQRNIAMVVIVTICALLLYRRSITINGNYVDGGGDDGAGDKTKPDMVEVKLIGGADMKGEMGCKMENVKKILWFSAPWCGHCHKFEPEWKTYVSMMAKKHKQILLEKINGDTAQELCKKYNILGYPTVVFVNKDETFKIYNGKRTAESLNHFCK